MTPNECLKEYFWELCKFTQCHAITYKQMKQNSVSTLFLYKINHPYIIVKLHSPVQKIYGWTFTQVQILQKKNDNPKVSHWKSVRFPFRGELIFSILQNFGKKINEQIDQFFPKKSKNLQSWMNAEIADVFVVTLRKAEVFGSQHAFFEIRTIFRSRYMNYFQMRKWKSHSWQGLLQIAQSEKIQKSCNFGDLFQEINAFINSFQVIRQQRQTNMFDKMANKKQNKRNLPKDDFQKYRERKVLQKYRLYQYVQK